MSHVCGAFLRLWHKIVVTVFRALRARSRVFGRFAAQTISYHFYRMPFSAKHLSCRLRRRQRLSCRLRRHERCCMITGTQPGKVTTEGSSCVLPFWSISLQQPIFPSFFPSWRAPAPRGESEKHCVCHKRPDPKIGVRSRARANRPNTLSNHVRKPTRRCVRPPERKCISDFSALLPVFPGVRRRSQRPARGPSEARDRVELYLTFPWEKQSKALRKSTFCVYGFA